MAAVTTSAELGAAVGLGALELGAHGETFVIPGTTPPTLPPRPRTPSLYVYPGLGIVEVPSEHTPVLGPGGSRLRGRRWRG